MLLQDIKNIITFVRLHKSVGASKLVVGRVYNEFMYKLNDIVYVPKELWDAVKKYSNWEGDELGKFINIAMSYSITRTVCVDKDYIYVDAHIQFPASVWEAVQEL
jgi:hypothetical protein